MTPEQEVREAAIRRAEALASHDADQLRALLHPRFVWTSHAGEVFDRDTYVRNNTSGMLVWKNQQLEDVDVRVSEPTAVLTATVVDEVERDGEPQRFRMPVTQIWLKEGGGWLCLAGHAGPLLA